ncbi:MAG: hypothetical protein QNJ65_21315 [Xenococcaceae cyanobacterium MO_234.B1]|nr:hypothetical protein [Xenococcaceae cyanobacterium MO_234.B1]
MNKNSSVLSITLVTGEEIDSKDLPVLKVYQNENIYTIFDDDKAITSAIIECLEHRKKSHRTVVSLVIEVIPGDKRTRRQTRKGGTK